MRGRALVLAILLSAFAPGVALAQPAPEAGRTAPEADVAKTIAAARQVLAAHYVLPDVARELDAALGRAASDGLFDGLAGDALAARVTAEMGKVTPDGHLRMLFQPRLAAVLPAGLAGQPPSPDGWDAALDRQMRSTNAGVSKLELLPGNIRYLAYDSFGWGTPAAERALATAMEFLRDGDALIIDLRNNAGGSAFAEARMASYFVEPGTRLARFELRGGSPAEETVSSEVPFSLAGKPTYVLVGPATVSAGELFATHAAVFGFATLVGARTGGAGYTIRFFPLPGGYVLNVSVGRTTDATTGTDWERVGIAPSLAASPDRALVAAQAAAMEKLLAAWPESDRVRGERLLAFYRAPANPPDPVDLSPYVGRYGDFTVAADSGRLTMRFGDFPPEELVPITAHLFAPAYDPSLVVRFVVEEGPATALELDSGTGPAVRTPRRAAS